MTLKDGNYTVVATVYQGEKLPVVIKIKHGKISRVSSQNTLPETSLNRQVLATLSDEICHTQNLNIDSVSGASYSTSGILTAVKTAVRQAGGKIKDLAEPRNLNRKDASKRTNTSNYMNWRETPKNVTRELNTDILIVGSGISGLAAAVQSGELGLKTIVIEKNAFVAGNGGGIEGIFGVETQMQKAAGIQSEPEKIIAREMELAQYRPDGSFWVDLVQHSAENIEWLVKNGVRFDRVDDYSGICEFPTFHWFEGNVASKGYVPYMKERADRYGVKFLLSTPAYSICYKNHRVEGIYAQNKDGFIKINAKAVILATGGVGHNGKLLAKKGWSIKNLKYLSMPSNTGDGYQLAMSVGAKDMLLESPDFMDNYIQALPSNRLTKMAPETLLAGGGSVVWVNQNGRRIVNENVASYNMLYQHMAIKATRATYVIFNQKIWDKIADQALPQFRKPDPDKMLFKAVAENNGHSLYKADTIDELAYDVAIPVESLKKTIADYNQFCHEGVDHEFNKERSMLIPIEQGPYYIGRLDNSNLVSLGGIGENTDFEVIDEDFQPILGLYAIGADATMQYRDVYTITLGGSACAHSVNSGRNAVKNAQKEMQK